VQRRFIDSPPPAIATLPSAIQLPDVRVNRGKEHGDAIRTLAGSVQHVGFPNAHDHPASSFEGPIILAITNHVSPHLRDPVAAVVAPCELCESPLEVAAVPEVAIAEDRNAMFHEHDVRAAG
jgi:hypothetical protein